MELANKLPPLKIILALLMVLIVFCHEDNSSHLKKSQKHKTIPNSTTKMPPSSTTLHKIGGSLAFSRVNQP